MDIIIIIIIVITLIFIIILIIVIIFILIIIIFIISTIFIIIVILIITIFTHFLRQSFLGVLLPDQDWGSFCQLWKYERETKALHLSNKLCFIIVTGRVDVYVTSVKTLQSNQNTNSNSNTNQNSNSNSNSNANNNAKIQIQTQLLSDSNQSTIAHQFKKGEVIHLFSNQDRIPILGDGCSLIFDNVRLTYMPEKGSQIISLDLSDYKEFMETRARLVSLSSFMKLKMSELVANHIYFEGVSPNKVS